MSERGTQCVYSSSRPATKRVRRRNISTPTVANASDTSRKGWSTEELQYLDTWAGTRSVGEMCQRLHRTERALRCQLHRCGLSAKVCESWSLEQLRTDMHLQTRTVRRYAVQGILRVHSAQVCTKHLRVAVDPIHLPPWTARSIPLSEAARMLRCPQTQILMGALTGRYRLINVRITEASVLRFSASHTFNAIRARLSPAMQCWLDASQKPLFN